MRRLLSVPEWAWLALAFVLRAGFALKLGPRLIQIDEGAFDAAAWSLAATGSLGPQGTVMPPVAPLFFALFYLVGRYPVYARIGQAIASTAAAWALGRATRELTDSEPASRLAVALASVYPFFVYYSGVLMSESLYVGCLIAGVWQLARSLRRSEGRLASAALAGLWLGLSALTRSEGAFIWIVIWAAATILCAKNRWPWKAWAVAVACWALPILGWCARNKAQTGEFTLDTHGGHTLLHGTMFFELNEIDTAFAVEAMKKEPFYQETEGLPETERDKVFRAKAFAFMKENPGRVLKQWAAKFLSFWRFYPRTDKAYHETETSSPSAGLGRKALVLISLLFEPALIIGGLIGLWRLVRRDWALFPLPLFILGTMGLHMISVSQMRYRLPVMPILTASFCWLVSLSLGPAPTPRPRHLTPKPRPRS